MEKLELTEKEYWEIVDECNEHYEVQYEENEDYDTEKGSIDVLVVVERIFDNKLFKSYYTRWPAGDRHTRQFIFEEIEDDRTSWKEIVEKLSADNKDLINKEYLIKWFEDRYYTPTKKL